jgi:uncharacterized protein YbbC (DUF1343 family)
MIKTGLEIFIENSEKYKKRGIALIANQTSVTGDLLYSWDVLREKGIHIKRIFTPEHGIFSTEQDQVAVGKQPEIDCETFSLYGDSYNSLIPDGGSLDDIDLVLFDIQDVGARYYTYVNTMALFMERISGRGIEMMVLDRPNPLGGVAIEGPLLQDDYRSFVGILPVAVRHGMTPGELALLYEDTHKLDLSLTVTRMRGWKRGMLFHETGLPWIAPSPNMPTDETACLYPGFCLVEGTNLSEGRGTTMPFKLIGAPYIEPYRLSESLNAVNLGGVHFRPVFFKPTFNKYSSEVVGGIYVHITDREAFSPFLTGVALIKTVRDMYGEAMIFLKDVYEFNDRHPAFDLLTGSSVIREMIDSGCSLDDIRESWRADEIAFRKVKREFNLY